MKQHKTGGFSLISLVIYIGLTTLLFCLLLSSSFGFNRYLLRSSQRVTDYLKLCVALDRMVYDLYRAPAERSQWKSCSTTEIRWDQNGKSVGWRYRKNNLTRFEGIFDNKIKKWRKRAKSKAADAVCCLFDLSQSSEAVTAITISLTSVQNSDICLKRTVVPRLGVLR